jgi:hypothetical protein
MKTEKLKYIWWITQRVDDEYKKNSNLKKDNHREIANLEN